MNKFLTILTTIICLATTLSAQTLTLEIPEVQGQQGQIVEVPITTVGFDSIVSLQFTFNWDASIITYEDYVMDNLMDAAIGEVEADEGNLRFSWFDADGSSETLPDGTTLMTLQFLVIGEIGEESVVEITGDPLEIQAFYLNNGNYEPTTLIGNTGAVQVIEPVSVSVSAQTGNIACFGDGNGFIDLQLFTNGNDYSVEWSGPNGFTSEDEDLNNLNGGNYDLMVFDTDGMVLLDTTYTIVEPLSALAVDELDIAMSNCGEPDGSALVSISGGTTPYAFDIGDGVTGQSDFQNLAPGTYNITITDANQCGLTDSFTIISTPLPQPAIDSVVAFCEGDSAMITVGQFAEYQWSTGEFLPTIFVAEAGEYAVTVTNDEGCTATASAMATAQDLVTLTLENDVLEICPGESVQLLVSGGDQYQWIDTTGAFSSLTVADPIVTAQETQIYTAIGSNSCNSDTIFVEVFVFEPSGFVMNDTCVFAGAELQLQVGGGAEYLWADAEYPLNANNIFNPTTTPEDSTFYAVEILDNNDCLTYDTIFVAVVTDPATNIPAINTLTPNGDGENDFLEFDASIEKFGPNRLTIMNRWGDVVYERINYQRDSERFDATKNGKPLPAGTYYYVLSFGNVDIKQALLIIN